MKKLLGLLGAIGLVATSSATVVACGGDDTNETDTTSTLNDKDGKVILSEGDLFLGKDAKLDVHQEGQSVHVLVHDALVAKGVDMTKIDYTLNKSEDSKTFVSVTVVPDAKASDYTGSVTMTLKAEDAPAKQDITSLKADVKVGATKADATKAITDAIVAVSENAKIDVDFTINFGSTFVEGTDAAVAGEITVDAVASSDLLTGTMKVTVTEDQPAAPKDFVVTGVTNNAVSVAAGATSTFTVAKAADDEGTPEIKVASDTKDNATVEIKDGTVTITAVAEGSAKITVSADGYNNIKITVTVTASA